MKQNNFHSVITLNLNKIIQDWYNKDCWIEDIYGCHKFKKETIFKYKKSNLGNYLVTIFKKYYKHNIIYITEYIKAAQFLGLEINSKAYKEFIQLIFNIIHELNTYKNTTIMGTNFYAILPVKKRTTNKLRELADKLDAQEQVNVDGEMYDIEEELKDCEIHLGKRSCGWVFLWDANELKYYEPTLESIKKFVDDNDAKIVDEYGEEFTWEQFIKDEIGNSLCPSDAITTTKGLKQLNMDIDRIGFIASEYLLKGLPYYHYCTSKTYLEMHPNESRTWFDGYRNYDKRLVKYAKDGVIDNNYSDFITKEGLRFALFTDFS